MDISKIRRNVSAISEGRWVENIPNAGDLRLLVRGMSAQQVRDYRAQLERAVSAEDRDRNGAIKSSKSMEILGLTLLNEVLLDWQNLRDNGNNVPYNPALAREWLTNPEYEAFGDAVVWAATFVDRMTATEEEAVVKN